MPLAHRRNIARHRGRNNPGHMSGRFSDALICRGLEGPTRKRNIIKIIIMYLHKKPIKLTVNRM